MQNIQIFKHCLLLILHLIIWKCVPHVIHNLLTTRARCIFFLGSTSLLQVYSFSIFIVISNGDIDHYLGVGDLEDPHQKTEPKKHLFFGVDPITYVISVLCLHTSAPRKYLKNIVETFLGNMHWKIAKIFRNIVEI